MNLPQDHTGIELDFWLTTVFQNTIEVAQQLSNNPAPQETPYVYKYEAIANLKQVIKIQHPYHFIAQTVLGEIYSDVDQLSDSVRAYEQALCSISNLPAGKIPKFYTNLIVLYNMLGISYINRQQNSEGLGCIAKAMEIYSLANQIKTEDVYHNRADQPRGRKFCCYVEGGINHEDLEAAHTLTLFYLAQSYTKLGLKDKAAESCGFTLQRQFATNKFEINDFCHNLIGLAEYYEGNRYYGQALYLLMLAIEILPEGKKPKMRAKVQIALADLESHMLEYSVQNIKKQRQSKKSQQQFLCELESLNEKSNRILLLFESFKQGFPKVKLAGNLQACKSLFRKAKTQYDHAIKVFILDGYVTEHIDILFAISKLYHQLCKLDTSRERVTAMLEKRRELLEPLLKELNKMAFPATWQKILVEVSEIYNDLFQLKTIMAIDVKDGKQKSDTKLKECVELGTRLTKYYQNIIEELQNDKEAEKNAQYYRSIINSKFNIAKTTSKMYSNDTKQRVGYLKTAFYRYKDVADYIKNVAKPEDEFEQELALTNEMIAMLPNKIDRINYGQVSSFQ